MKTKRGRQTTHSERGAALMMAVMLMGVFGLFGAAYWSHLHLTLAQTRATAKAQAAHALADAGIQRAIAEFRAGNAAFKEAGPEPLAGGTYQVVVDAAENESLRVTSTGALGDAQEAYAHQTVRALVRLGAGGKPVAVQYLAEGR